MMSAQLRLFDDIRVAPVPAPPAPIEASTGDADICICCGLRYSATPKEGWVHVRCLRKRSDCVSEPLLDEAWVHPNDIMHLYTNRRTISWGSGPHVRLSGSSRFQGNAYVTFELVDHREYNDIHTRYVVPNCEKWPARANIMGCTPEEATAPCFNAE